MALNTNKNSMTDEDRLALAAKLDQELNEFIDGLERKRYTEGWPEDRWEEEMDKHPFFMKGPPKEDDKLDPLMEGLQQLKYDPDENTNEDLANTYKEDGNFYMKHKKYRMAMFSYTEGLNMKCENAELNSILYNNRSASHYFLENYRSALSDAQKSLKLNPNYIKANIRAANCLFFLNKFDDSLAKCDEILNTCPKEQTIHDLRRKVQQAKSNKIRDQRKQAVAEKKKNNESNKLISVIKKRNIRFEEQGKNSEIDDDMLIARLAPLEDYPVHLDESGCLVWPAAFCYPQFLFSDFQQKLSEEVIMFDILVDMFTDRLECDKNHEYKAENLNVYFENRALQLRCKVDVYQTIQKILSHKHFLVSGGCLTFFVVPKNSQVEREYISQKVLPGRQ